MARLTGFEPRRRGLHINRTCAFKKFNAQVLTRCAAPPFPKKLRFSGTPYNESAGSLSLTKQNRKERVKTRSLSFGPPDRIRTASSRASHHSHLCLEKV